MILKPVGLETWVFEVPAEEGSDLAEVAYVMGWGFEISASALLVAVEAEDVEAWHLQTAFAVDLQMSDLVENVGVLHLEADIVAGLVVGVEVESVEASRLGCVAEPSGNAEAEIVVERYSEVSSVVGYLELVEAVDVATLCVGYAVALVLVEDVEE